MEQSNHERVLFSLEDAAGELGGISVWTLRKHIAQGTIRTVHIGRRVFLPAEEIARIQRDGLPSLRLSSSQSALPVAA